MRLDVKRDLFARSDRVKSVDFHPTEPWVLCSLYSGSIHIWSYATQQLVKTFEVCEVPVRAGRFIARKNWLVCGSDDFQLRVYNYNTSEKVSGFEAHPDYIRAIVVHPQQPFVLTSSDDMTIKLWNWEKSWKCERVFEGHAHYVMSLAINPKDNNTFASACLDRTIKIWSLGSSTPMSTIEAHEQKGVNYVEYYPHSDKPYILSSSDDRTAKIWDYTTKSLIATLEGHQNNVSFACYHPELPIIITGSEDGSIRIFNASTYRFEQSLNYGLERAWCVAYMKGKQGIGIGYDDGAVVVSMGREDPAVSMDSSGKLVWARNNDVLSAIVKGGDASVKDGAPIPLPSKELGTNDVFSSFLKHSPNGRFVAVCGDGEYIVYTALAWRNKAFGQALDFCWSNNSNDFAIRESPTSVKIFKNFTESKNGSLDVGFAADGLSGGHLLGVRGAGGVSFFDWASGGLVRRVEVEPRQVYWSDNGEMVTLACEDSFYILRFDREAYTSAVQTGDIEEDGVAAAFEVITDINEKVRTGCWVGAVFIYTNTQNRLNYLVGESTYTISHTDQPLYILGYLQRDSRIYLADKNVTITSYALSLPVLEYQTVVLQGDMDTAAEILPTIPQQELNKVSRFLEAQGLKELALEVATDPEHRFDLALGLGRLDLALELAREADLEPKWKIVGDAALSAWDVGLAAECFEHAKDLGSLLLVYSSTSDKDGLEKLAAKAAEAGAHNVSFTCKWLLGDIDGCVEILTSTGRLAEAVLFSQTYKPSLTAGVVGDWKQSLEKAKKGRVAKMLGTPGEDDDLFPEWDEWLKLERDGITIDAGENGFAAAAADGNGEVEMKVEEEADDE